MYDGPYKLLDTMYFIFLTEGPGWPNELGNWTTYQLIQAYQPPS